MLITRTPLRVSLGGGGTDLPSYYRQRGGFVVAAAIDKHIYVAVNRTFTDDISLKYSTSELVTDAAHIAHPIVRHALSLYPVPLGVEIASMADIPAGTGLGSSGAFTVGLLHALGVPVDDLAEEACRVEIDLMGQPCGKQDQYVAVCGGLNRYTFHPDDTVDVAPLAVSDQTKTELESRLLLFFTGYSRSATLMLADQHRRTVAGDRDMLAGLDRTKEFGYETATALESGDLDVFAKLMHEHWETKRRRTPGMSNERIDRWYRVALESGAVGGKLVGAGAGGFLMLYCGDPRTVRWALTREGLREVPFRFDPSGSTVIAR